MAADDDRPMVSAWAYSALQPKAIESARAVVSAPLSQVPRQHGDICLTTPAHAFLAYWWHVRGDKVIPDTDDVSPPDMGTLAPYVRYLHWQDDALIHRLWGSALTESTGVDLTGEDMLAYVAPERRDSRRKLFKAAGDHPCGCVLVVRSESMPQSGIAFEMTFLPVAVSPDDPPRLIGTLQWCEAREVFDPAPYKPEEDHLLAVEKTAFIDIGAGVADPLFLKHQ